MWEEQHFSSEDPGGLHSVWRSQTKRLHEPALWSERREPAPPDWEPTPVGHSLTLSSSHIWLVVSVSVLSAQYTRTIGGTETRDERGKEQGDNADGFKRLKKMRCRVATENTAKYWQLSSCEPWQKSRSLKSAEMPITITQQGHLCSSFHIASLARTL